jgi:hypoxanthine phosphoribosyltransferase
MTEPKTVPNMKVEWPEFISLITSAAHQIKYAHPEIDTIVALSRGGLLGATIMSHVLEVKRVYSFGINFYSSGNKIRKVPNIYQNLPDTFWSSNILVVDDVADSGKSLEHVLNTIKHRFHTDGEIIVYTTFYKPKSKIKPQFYSEIVDSAIWIDFPYSSAI